MANVLKLYKGAVQPAETGASGNEIKLYKGAVEPAYVAPAGGSGTDTRTGPSLSFGSMGKLGAQNGNS